jgi:O-antigen/teichoic acid export membrane protein|tara:strand:- start:859 stop:2379 length:1521 start_codon:yes stop_codon:yes gene_type:complete
MSKQVSSKDIKSSKLNAFTNYLSFGINMILGLIASPLVLEYLGSTNFGIYKAVQKFLGFATVADGRATQALKWVIAKNEGSTDEQKKKQAIGSALLVWFIFLPILIIVICLLVYFMPSLINELDHEQIYNVRKLTLLLGTNLFLISLIGISNSVLVGTNQGYKSILVKIFWMVVFNIVLIYILYLGYGFTGIGIVTLLFTILQGINVYYLAKKHVKWFGVLQPNKKDLKTFLNFSGWTLMWVFVSKLLLSSEIILLSYISGGSSVSNYVFSSYIIQIGITIAALLTSSLTPTLGKVYGGDDYSSVEKIIKNLRNLVFSWTIFIGGINLLFNKLFISYWVGVEYYVGDIPNLLFVILMVELVIIRNEAFIINVSIQIKEKVFVGAFSVILSLLFAYSFSFFFTDQIIGILLGLLIGRLIMLLGYPYLVSKYLRVKVTLKMDAFKKIITSTILLATTYFIGINLEIESILLLISLVLISTITLAIIIFKFLVPVDLQSFIQKKIIKLK